MKKTVYMIALLTFSLTVTTSCNAQRHIKKIKSFFSGRTIEKIDQRELPAVSIETVVINNINGPITIQTGWKKNSLFLKTTKRAKKQEDLNNIKIAVDSNQNNQLTISTKHINKKLHGSVEYELIVPATLNVILSISGAGDASVKDISGNITVVTNDNIFITNTKKAVNAQSLKKGTVSISGSLGPVDAHAYQGNIIGDNIAHSFTAHSTTGKVWVTSKELPSTGNIDLKTTSGNIMLCLPADTNAAIKGHTAHGTLSSDHYITVKPYLTKLNTAAWNKFKREIDGILGSGEATIALHSTQGNIKIMETKTT